MNNPYIILNIPQNATDEEIKKAYRKIAKATHPDLNGGDTSKAEQFTQATEAYRFLLDKDKRSQYDYFATCSEYDATRAYEAYAEKSEDAAVDYQQFIRDMISEIKESKFNARFSILGGLFLMVIGIVATLFTYFSADPGENFTIMSGFMIIGGIGVVKSLFSYGSLLSKIKDYENDVWSRILGHKPTNVDEDYVSYNKIVHPMREKLKSFLLIILVIACVIGMVFFYIDIQDGNLDGVSTDSETINTEQKLYDELVTLNEQLSEMESKLKSYENQLSQLEKQYNDSPTESLYNQYYDLYDEYESYYNKYTEKNNIFKDKYEYFDETYGFEQF